MVDFNIHSAKNTYDNLINRQNKVLNDMKDETNPGKLKKYEKEINHLNNSIKYLFKIINFYK